MAPWTPETPWLGPKKKTQLDWPDYVCRNSQCPSVGKSHPNCRCGAPYAEGGQVEPFCSKSQPHKPGCEYYAEGGQVQQPQSPEAQDQPQVTLPHAIIEHGLSSVLDGHLGHVGGHFDVEKNDQFIDQAKAIHSRIGMAPPTDGREEHVPEPSRGTEFGRHLYAKDHGKAADALMGSALAGRATKRTLAPILQRIEKPLLENETSSEGLKSAIEYLHSSARGAASLDDKVKEIFNGKRDSEDKKGHRENREILKKRLKELQEDPNALFEIGGKLGHYLPDHAMALGATSARAVEYLNSLKPKEPQDSPLDEPMPADVLAEDKYHRALDLAERPLKMLSDIKTGTLQPEDVATIGTIYPELYKSIKEKVFDQVLSAKVDGQEIPYRSRAALSLILGEPIDSTLAPENMMAIINSQAKSQPQQAQGKKGKSGATAAELKAIETASRMEETPLQERQIDRKA